MQRLTAMLLLAGAAAAGACATRPTPPPDWEYVPPPEARDTARTDTVRLLVAATTDVHGRLRGWDYFRNAPDTVLGLARAATVVDSLRAAAPGRVVLVDAGDLLQGNPLTYVAARVAPDQPHPVIAAMNAMAYDAAAVGNHEFNYGLDTFGRAVGEARFPFLAANAYTADGKRAYPAFRLVERGPVTVGLVGATTPGSLVWDRENLRGRLDIRPIVPEVRTAVAEARAAGADVVVVTVHSGLHGPASYDTVTTGVGSENQAARIAHEVPGVDLIVFGHSHGEVADTTINGVLLMQPRNFAASVGVAELAVARRGGAWRVVDASGRTIRTVGRREHPGVLAATQAAHERTVAYATDSIGHTADAWRSDSARVQDTPIVDLVLEVMRRTAGTDLASTAAFSTRAALGPGKITVADVAQLYPYDNTLVGIRITGKQLREYLERSARYFGTYGTGAPAVDPEVPGFNYDMLAGAEYTLDLSRPVGGRVTDLRVAGRPVRDTDTFTLALNNYRQGGGGGFAMLHGAPVVYDRQDDIRQLLIDEVRRRGTIRHADYFTPNWRLTPDAARAAAQAAIATPGPAR